MIGRHWKFSQFLLKKLSVRIFKFDIVRNLLENQKRPENKYLGMIMYRSGDLQNVQNFDYPLIVFLSLFRALND